MKLKELVLRTIVIITVGLLFSFSSYGDAGSTKVINKNGDLLIEYDFLKGELQNERCIVWFRKNITFKVINVNPFLFKTTISVDEVNHFSEIPIVFQKISEEAMDIGKETQEAQAAVDNIKNQEIATAKNTALANMNKTGADKPNLLSYLMETEKSIEAEYASVNTFFDAYNKLVKIPGIYNALRQILLANKKYDSFKKEITQQLSSILEEEKRKLENVYPTLNSLIGDANDKYGKIDFKSLEEKSKSNCDLKGVIDQLKACKKIIEKIENEKVIDGIAELLNKFAPVNFERSVIIPTVESDEILLGVKVEALDASNTTVPQEVVGKIRVRVKRGWTINYSTGAIFQINAHDRTYRLDKMENDPDKVVIRENSNDNSITPSIAAFMHVYPRSIRSVKWGGITFGIGAKNTDQLSYYCGTCFMFGFLKRFIINFGGTLTKIDTLKPEYQIDQAVDVSENLKPEDLVQKDYKLKLFVGFTYNLTTK